MIGPRSSTGFPSASMTRPTSAWPTGTDRKSTRLNSSHDQISYAVFCLKKKKEQHVLKVDLQSVWVDADAVRLDQVVTNLLDNAAKYTPACGSIDVSLHAAGGHAELANS